MQIANPITIENARVHGRQMIRVEIRPENPPPRRRQSHRDEDYRTHNMQPGSHGSRDSSGSNSLFFPSAFRASTKPELLIALSEAVVNAFPVVRETNTLADPSAGSVRSRSPKPAMPA